MDWVATEPFLSLRLAKGEFHYVYLRSFIVGHPAEIWYLDSNHDAIDSR